MASFINDVFSEKLVEDDRIEIELFTSKLLEGTVFFRPPHIAFWNQALLIIFFSSVFATLLAAVVFKGIIEQRHTSSSYIIGYGVIIPLLLYLPFFLINVFDIQNTMLRFACTICPVLNIFRTMEAMHGYSPGKSEDSIKTYLVYYRAIGEVFYDKETNEPSSPGKGSIVSKNIGFIIGLLVTGFYGSFLIPYDFTPFETVKKYDMFHMLSFGHNSNNMLVAILVQLYLFTLLLPLALLTNVFHNIETKTGMKNAMFESTSMSDFWGKKWNLLIQGVLKRGVFKPVKSVSSSSVAAVCTFMASGLFHEWIVQVITFDGANIFHYEKFGSQLKFFIWNAAFIVIESIVLRKVDIWENMRTVLPVPIVSIIITMFAVPVAHWFLNHYIEARMLHHAQIGFPTLVLKS